MQLLEDFPHFSLWHDPSCDCLYASWWGEHTGIVTRVQYDLIRWHLRVTSSTKLLNDSLLDQNGWSQVTCWLANDGLRLLARDGLQIIAWVLPQHAGAFFDTARVLAQAKEPLIDTFTDAQAAYDWLHRWPLGPSTAPTPTSLLSMSAAKFLLLAPNEQLETVKQMGRPLAPRWEPDYYVKPYHLLDTLLVEVYYQLHSGVFQRLQAQLIR
ncbi:MAG: hypothetical protein EOO62_03405 [Hymenobacter sp.]|nr:MAG: hypothetical protein EOO62_03405 [Hymenobacter sp.]